jgi:hypothetical protein
MLNAGIVVYFNVHSQYFLKGLREIMEILIQDKYTPGQGWKLENSE